MHRMIVFSGIKFASHHFGMNCHSPFELRAVDDVDNVLMFLGDPCGHIDTLQMVI